MALRLVSLASLALLLTLAGPAAGRTLRLGYYDSAFLADPGGPALSLAAADRVRIVRITLPWYAVATQRPAAPTDPADPVYDWSGPDAAARAATAKRLQVLITLDLAPPWAEGPGRAPAATPGSWRPDADALGAFATAAAKHYSGQNSGVPRVRLWQAWNEPNLGVHLSPQYDNGAEVAASHYRSMLNAVYRGVKSVDAGSTIVTAGASPFGDDPGGVRTRPLAFWRSLLCLRNGTLKRTACPSPAHFDAWSHHPYGVGGPRAKALAADDVTVPDLGKIIRVVRKAVAAGTALPHRAKQGWITEFGWDSNPPDPGGIPAAKHARWVAGALFAFWRAGVTTALNYQVIDAAPTPSYDTTNQSATHLRDGTPKLSDRAFRFPFATTGPGRRTLVWGLAPAAGRVTVQRRSRQGWRAVRRVRASRGRIFTVRLRAARGTVLRARAGAKTSLTWQVGRDG